MTARSRARRVALALAVGAAGLAVFQGCTGTDDSRVPPRAEAANPTPGDTVRAYLESVSAGDEAAAAAYLTPAHLASVRETIDGPFQRHWAVSDLRVGPGRRDSHLASADRWTDVVYLPVRFSLPGETSPSMGGSGITWGYVLVRNHPDEAWRIDDEGVG